MLHRFILQEKLKFSFCLCDLSIEPWNDERISETHVILIETQAVWLAV